jgi:hypothetical protein
MSVRSGVFIKYVIDLTIAPGGAGAAVAGAVAGAVAAAAAGPAAAAGAIAGGAAAAAAAGATTKLTVSNDVLAGDFCIDADISVKMHRWAAGSEFEIKLYDLPEAKVSAIEETLKSITTPRVTISLGYFDTQVQAVLEGVYDEVNRDVANDKLLTTIKGREKASFACATSYTGTLEGKKSYKAVVSGLLSQAPLPKDCISAEPQVNDNLPSDLLNNFTFSGKVLFSIDDLAKRANAEFFIVDGKVFFGAPVLNDLVDVAQLDYAVNLAKFDPITQKMLSADNGASPDSKDEIQVKGFKFTVVGDPKMRPGQKIVVNNIKKYKSPEFRIRHVEHSFSSSAGYTCVGAATEQLKDGAMARSIDSKIDHTSASAATRVTDRIRSQPAENPVIEVAGIKGAGDAYQASLYYGQRVPGNETQPSINVAINQQNDHLYKDKPIASSFAWRKCGLVTPVYAGMKALVVHNRAIASDGIVAGYIWSKQPDFAPPASHAGDWWLCLPIDFDATQAPNDQTKAVNDLTGNTGKRVIEVKGLRITVGAGKLASIGSRPTEGADDDFLIEHVSGTSVHIDSNGALTVDASKASLTIKGDVVIEGSLEIK